MSDTLKDVLIIQVGGNFHDLAIVVNELPKNLFYHKNFPRVPKLDRDGEPTGNLKRDRAVGKIADELKPGIKMSPAFKGGFVIDIQNQEGEQRFRELSSYITTNLPAGTTAKRFEPLCVEPGNPSSPPRPISQLPRVELPVSSPPVSSNEDAVQASPSTLKRGRGRPKASHAK